jgi:hypothetical protein
MIQSCLHAKMQRFGSQAFKNRFSALQAAQKHAFITVLEGKGTFLFGGLSPGKDRPGSSNRQIKTFFSVPSVFLW